MVLYCFHRCVSVKTVKGVPLASGSRSFPKGGYPLASAPRSFPSAEVKGYPLVLTLVLSQVLLGEGGGGTPNQVLGQDQEIARTRAQVPPPQSRTRKGISLLSPPLPQPGPGQGYPNFPRPGPPSPSPTQHTPDRICRRWYPSCGHVGGLSCCGVILRVLCGTAVYACMVRDNR